MITTKRTDCLRFREILLCFDKAVGEIGNFTLQANLSPEQLKIIDGLPNEYDDAIISCSAQIHEFILKESQNMFSS